MEITYQSAQDSDAALLIDIYNQSFYEDYVRYGECPAYGRTVEQMKISIEKYPKEIIFCDQVPVGAVSLYKTDHGHYEVGCLCVIPHISIEESGKEP